MLADGFYPIVAQVLPSFTPRRSETPRTDPFEMDVTVDSSGGPLDSLVGAILLGLGRHGSEFFVGLFDDQSCRITYHCDGRRTNHELHASLVQEISR